MLTMLHLFRKLRDDKAGLAAVEFALVLPALLALIFGAIEVTNIMVAKTDTTNIASTAADLVAQESAVNNADIANVFSAMTALIYPYDGTNAKIIITSIIDDGKGGGKVAWSDGYHTTGHTKNASMSVPAGLMTSGGSVILSEVTYTYKTPSNYLVKLPVSMSNTFYSHPRRVAQITRTAN